MPTTIAAKAPRALKTFLDAAFLVLVVPVLEGLELPLVLLGLPEEPPGLGVAVESG